MTDLNTIQGIIIAAAALGFLAGYRLGRAKVEEWVRAKFIFYGPYRCGCGQMVCKTAQNQGGVLFDYPEGPIYPNTEWNYHRCLEGGESNAV